MKRIFLIILFYLLLSNCLYAQVSKLVVLDKNSFQPVPYPVYSVRTLEGAFKFQGTGNADGIIEIKLDIPSILDVSRINYIKTTKTITPETSDTIYLAATSTEIDEVVVTGQYVPTKVDNSIYKVTLIGKQQLALQGSSNLSQALAARSELQTTRDPVFGSGIKIQGLSGNNVKILIDGIPVIGRTGGTIDLNQLPLNNISHIEFVEGPMSVVYGSNALAGVINIITTSSSAYKYETTLNTLYESVGTYNIDGSINFNKGSHFLHVDGGRYFFGGYSANDTSRAQEFDPREQYFANIKYKYNRIKDVFIFNSGIYRDLLIDKDSLHLPDVHVFDAYYYTFRLSQSLAYNHQFSKRLKSNILGSYSYYSRAKNIYIKDLSTLQKQLTLNTEDHDTSVFQSANIRGTIFLNTDTQKISVLSGIDINLNNGMGNRIMDHSQSINEYAAFVSAKFVLLKSFEAQPGLRYAYNNKYKIPLLPSINFRYSFGNTFTLRASYAHGFRAPDIKELFLIYKDVNHDIEPNATLLPEDGHHTDLTINYINAPKKSNSSYKVSTGIFYNTIKNNITLALVQQNVTGADLYQYVNLAYLKTVGGHLGLNYKYQNFSLYTQLNLTGIYYSLTKEEPSLNDYIYTTNAAIGINYNLNRYGFIFNLLYKYNGRSVEYLLSENETINEGIIDDYNIIDASINKNLFNRRLDITGGIKNLLNVKEIDRTGTFTGYHNNTGNTVPVEWGRTWFISLRAQLYK